jgi:hypothetical protein
MLHLAEFSGEDALALAEVWLFGPGALPLLGTSPSRSGRHVGLAALSEWIGAAGGDFHVKVADACRQYRGDPLDLLYLNRIVLDRLDPGIRRPYNNRNRIEGRVRIDDAASVRASVIAGP